MNTDGLGVLWACTIPAAKDEINEVRWSTESTSGTMQPLPLELMSFGVNMWLTHGEGISLECIGSQARAT